MRLSGVLGAAPLGGRVAENALRLQRGRGSSLLFFLIIKHIFPIIIAEAKNDIRYWKY